MKANLYQLYSTFPTVSNQDSSGFDFSSYFLLLLGNHKNSFKFSLLFPYHRNANFPNNFSHFLTAQNLCWVLTSLSNYFLFFYFKTFCNFQFSSMYKNSKKLQQITAFWAKKHKRSCMLRGKCLMFSVTTNNVAMWIS